MVTVASWRINGVIAGFSGKISIGRHERGTRPRKERASKAWISEQWETSEKLLSTNELQSNSSEPGNARWRYIMAACVAFVLICLWRSSFAQGFRPTVGFGAPWRDIVLAWLPEGIVLGLSSFTAQRIFGGRQGATRGIPIAAAGFYLILWLPVWTLGVIVPGGTVLNVFSNSLSPLKETFYAGGPVGGIVAGGVLLAYASICLMVVLIELLAAAAWAGLMQSTMTASALQGNITYQPEAHIGWVLRSAILAGALFWGARLVVIAVIEGPLWRGVVDAAVTVLLIGVYARHIASRPATPPRGSSSTPVSGGRANTRGA